MKEEKKRLIACCVCDDCYRDKRKDKSGMTHYCKITGNDVGQEHFGLGSPSDCPLKGKYKGGTGYVSNDFKKCN